ncbi:hypothetical protein GCM10009720_11860 [Yaniella flava]|uniref:Uncharacterized protein n=1 Tax=Yaniella flava TaxID=287930 RepID=A0ABP5FSF9_9MICC|nr:hypothetical protein [Micrococcaceae bacterium]
MSQEDTTLFQFDQDYSERAEHQQVVTPAHSMRMDPHFRNETQEQAAGPETLSFAEHVGGV